MLLQYELWQDCNQHCLFCENINTKCNKSQVLDFVQYDLQKQLVTSKYDTVGFIGGEIFNLLDDVAYDKLIQILRLCAQAINDKKLANIYIATALIYNLDCIKAFLTTVSAFIELSNIRICTSYDVYGRFHTEQQEKVWKYNMQQLNILFPNLTFHIETILTQQFINMVLNDKFDTTLFKKTYNIDDVTYVQFTTCCLNTTYTIDEAKQKYGIFLPKRIDFINFIHKECILSQHIKFNQLLNINRLATKLIRCNTKQEINKQLQQQSKLIYPGYIDSDIPIIDDVQLLQSTQI